jgi:hypothetical protein
MSAKYVYRPTSSWIYLGLILATEIVVTYSFISANHVADSLWFATNSLAFDFLFWVFVVKPKIVFTDESISLTNPFQSVQIGWDRALEFKTQYSFTVQTSVGDFRSWAATAPGRFMARSMRDSDLRGTGLAERKVISPADSPRTDSGVALILALKRRTEATANGTAGNDITKRVHWFSCAAAIASTLTLLLNFLHG